LTIENYSDYFFYLLAIVMLSAVDTTKALLVVQKVKKSRRNEVSPLQCCSNGANCDYTGDKSGRFVLYLSHFLF